MTLRLGGDGAITGCTSLENPDLTVSGLTISGSFDAEKVLVASGTAAAPSYTFSGDTDNGLYYAGTDQVAISTNGTEKLRIISGGELDVPAGIGAQIRFENQHSVTTDAAISTFDDANGTLLCVGSNFYFNSSGSETRYNTGEESAAVVLNRNGTIDLSTGDTTLTATSRLRITADGNVGIGTSSPSAPLVVNHTSTSGTDQDVARFETQSGGDLKIQASDLSSANPTWKIYTPGNEEITLGSNNGEAIHIDGSNNVGIGTTSPTPNVGNGATLHLSGASTTSEVRLTRGNGTDVSITAGSTSGGCGIQSSEHIGFSTNGANERIRIDSSGRLLVGTSSSTADAIAVFLGRSSAPGGTGGEIKLAHPTTNVPASGTLGRIQFGNTGDDRGAEIAAIANQTWTSTAKGSYLTFSTTANGASSPTERMRIKNNGSISVFSQDNFDWKNSASPGTSFTYATGLYGVTSNAGTGTVSLRIWNNGNIQNTNNSYSGLSDIKLKENIVDANSQWNDIKDLRVRNYNFIEGQTHTQIGVIAQEVEPISPGLVYESPDRDIEGNDLGTTTKSVNYSVLYMKAVKALQEAMERIETLEAKVAALEAS